MQESLKPMLADRYFFLNGNHGQHRSSNTSEVLMRLTNTNAYYKKAIPNMRASTFMPLKFIMFMIFLLKSGHSSLIWSIIGECSKVLTNFYLQ